MHFFNCWYRDSSFTVLSNMIFILNRHSVLFPGFLILILAVAACSDLRITEQELDELPGIREEIITTYRIPLIPEEFLDELRENLTEGELITFLLQWIAERQEKAVELKSYDQFGNLIYYEYSSSETDSVYTERYLYTERLTVLEVETEINGIACEFCRPDRVERELNILLEPVKEQVFQRGEFLYEERIVYNQPGEVYSVQRNLEPGGEELYTEFFTYIPRDQRSSLIRRQQKIYSNQERIRIVDYGYDPAGYLARVTEMEDLPVRS
ncbi:MAG: hypothetical protein EA360_00830, partial [Balneolaceae bacterium]